MKVIGRIEKGRYICEVNHTEIEQFLGLYYGNMKEIHVGDIIDLGKGYNYAEKVETAMRKTSDFIAANKQIIKAITDGISIVGNIKEGESSE
jgi:hypothetical protein